MTAMTTAQNASPLLMVKEFTQAFDLNWKDEPFRPADNVAALRVQLLLEETGELAHGLAARDNVELVDALSDIDYVTYGAMGAFGTYTEECNGFFRPANSTPRFAIDEAPMWVRLEFTARLLDALTKFTLCAADICHPKADISKTGLKDMPFILTLVASATSDLWAVLGLEKYREAAFREVHESNMSKLGADGKPILNEAGRVVKGPNYRRPDLAAVVARIDSEGVQHG